MFSCIYLYIFWMLQHPYCRSIRYMYKTLLISRYLIIGQFHIYIFLSTNFWAQLSHNYMILSRFIFQYDLWPLLLPRFPHMRCIYKLALNRKEKYHLRHHTWNLYLYLSVNWGLNIAHVIGKKVTYMEFMISIWIT